MSNGDLLTRAKRLVVKIGSTLLVEPDTGALHTGWLSGMAADLADCRAAGQRVVLVSSGAIALGQRTLELGEGSSAA